MIGGYRQDWDEAHRTDDVCWNLPVIRKERCIESVKRRNPLMKKNIKYSCIIMPYILIFDIDIK